MCIDFDGEPAYDTIKGTWTSEQPYAVIHRVAFAKIGCGIHASKEVFMLVKELCIIKEVHSIRIDTDQNNKGMMHILKREGYTYCGTVTFQGSPKLAYELDF